MAGRSDDAGSPIFDDLYRQRVAAGYGLPGLPPGAAVPDVLHDDDPAAEVTLGDGRVVRNLTAEEYAASYADGKPHRLPDDVLAALPPHHPEGQP